MGGIERRVVTVMFADLVGFTLAIEVAAALGDSELAAPLEQGLAPWAGHHVVLGSGAVCLGSASHDLGLAARVRGELDVAASHLRQAIRTNDAVTAAPAAARSRAELARTLYALDHRDDASELASDPVAGRRSSRVDLLDLPTLEA